MTATNDNASRKRDALQHVDVVQEILRRWDPIGGQSVPAGEYDSYAPPIVSKVARGCSLDQLCTHLEGILVEMGIEPSHDRDREVAVEILRALRNTAV